MKKYNISSSILKSLFGCFLLLFVFCLNVKADETVKFSLPVIPDSITSLQSRADYFVLSYWNEFYYEDNIVDSEQIYVDFITILEKCNADIVPIAFDALVSNIKDDFNAIDFIIDVSEKFLLDKSSPYKNHEKLAILFNILLKEEALNNNQKENVFEIVTKAERNKPGSKAPDFSMVTSKGENKSFYDIRSEYTLLFLFDPLCQSCLVMGEELILSPCINNAVERKGLSVVYVTPYTDPDNKLAESFPGIPDNWTLSCNSNEQIIREKLYFWDYIPSIYLLDKDKNVIMKDVLPEYIEEFFEIAQ